LKNAAKYAPAGSAIEILAGQAGTATPYRSAASRTHGPGFPAKRRRRAVRRCSSAGESECRQAWHRARPGHLQGHRRSPWRTTSPPTTGRTGGACVSFTLPQRHSPPVIEEELPVTTPPKPKVLIIEDEEADSPLRPGAAVEAEACAGRSRPKRMAQGLLEAGTRKPDLLILDLGLPDGNGIELIRDLRGWSDVPVLILSARSQENDKIDALDAGADDYLTKPFSVGELRARVRALLRRRARSGEAASPLVEFGNIAVDLSRRLVTRGGEPVHLTPIEYRLLSTLLGQPGKVLTQRNLLREIWGPSYIESSHYLRVYVGHLRQKLEDDPTQPKHFLTETGVGYRFQP
jgi:two-component system KDP operon response regulator KdpE